ncbi:unnamed protein product [Camellia sinensis]
MNKPTFKENFMNDWRKILGKNHVIQKLEDCDFTPIYEWHQREKEKKKQMSSEYMMVRGPLRKGKQLKLDSSRFKQLMNCSWMWRSEGNMILIIESTPFASQAWMEWLMKKRKAFDQRGDMAVAAWAEQQQREMNLCVCHLSRSKVTNSRGDVLQCSHYMPIVRLEGKALPCVLIHGCRADASEATIILLPSNITVFTLDFSGSGLSGGEHVT